MDLQCRRIRKYPDSPSARYQFRCGFSYFFNSEERIQKYQDLLPTSPDGVDGSRIWKEKAADPKISGYVWTGLKSCSSVCLGLSDLYVRFWKLLPQKKNVSAGSDIFYLAGRGR